MSKPPRSVKASTKGPAQAATPAPPVAGTPLRLLENPLLHLLLLAIVGLIAYSNTFHAPFVFDDLSSIVDNPVVKDLSNFLAGAGYAYNPRRFIGYLSFALNYRLGGLDVTGYHLVNLTIHIVTAWLVYFFVRLTLRTPFFAVSSSGLRVSGSETSNSKLETRNLVPLLAALLFVAHPVQTQAVTYIVQRLASLATLFYLLSLVFYVKARLALQNQLPVSSFEFRVSDSTSNQKPETRNQKLEVFLFLALSLISAILAMRTKEIAATLPLVVVLFEFSFFRASARKKLLFLIPLLLTILIIPLGMLHAGKPLGELLSDVSEMARETRVISRGDYLLTQFSVIVTYIRLIFFPVNQNLDYDYPIYHSLFTPRVFLSFVFLLALFGLALYLYQRSGKPGLGNRDSGTENPNSEFRIPNPELRLIAFGILWFFITLAVESSVIPITDVIYEHRLYLPSVGAFIALAALAALVFKKSPPRTLLATATVLTLLLAAATWHRNRAWADNLTLWMDNVEKSPAKYRPHTNLGKYLMDRGEPDEARKHLLLAVNLNPASFEAHHNLGYSYLKQGEANLAIEQFQLALKLIPGIANTHYCLGEAYALKGYGDAAIEHYRLALKLQLNDAEAHFKLAIALVNKGNSDEAIYQLQSALHLKPDFSEAHNNLGVVYGMKGDADKAIEHFQAAARLWPDDPDSHINLARAYDMKGWTAKAEKERRLAEELGKRGAAGK